MEDKSACPDPRLLTAFAVGELPGPASGDIEHHLESCATCQRRLAELDRQTDPVVEALREARRTTMTTVTVAGTVNSVGGASFGLAPSPLLPVEQAGSRIGRYRLLEQIGEG